MCDIYIFICILKLFYQYILEGRLETIWRPPTGGCDSPRPPPVHDYQLRGQHHHELLYVQRQEKPQGGGEIQEGGNPGRPIEYIRWETRNTKEKTFIFSWKMGINLF